MRKVFVVFVLHVLSMSIYRDVIGQDLTAALHTMRDQFQDQDGLHIAMDVNVFTNSKERSPYYSLDVDIKKSGENYLYRYGTSEMLMSENFLIMVDRQTRSIMVSNRDKKSEVAFLKNFQFNPDSVLKEQAVGGQYMGVVNGTDHYRLMPANGDVQVINMFFDKETKILKLLTYEYENEQLVTITFKAFESVPDFASSTFLESNYIHADAGKYVGASMFRNFQVLQPEPMVKKKGKQ